MSAETSGSGDSSFNIFLYLAKLEQDGMNTSNQSKATILAKLNYQEEEYKNQISQWKSASDQIGKDADKAQKDADKAGGFWNSMFGKILSLVNIGTLIYCAVKGKGAFSSGDTDADGDQGKMSQDVQVANQAQTQVQQTQQKMSMTENIELNSQQQAQQSMQNMYNSMVQNFGSMGSYNNQRG